jgi:hypothetical protein
MPGHSFFIKVLHDNLSVKIHIDSMHPAFVPPSGPITREMIIAGTRPDSLTRKIRLALFDLGIGRTGHGFPYLFWLLNKKQ